MFGLFDFTLEPFIENLLAFLRFNHYEDLMIFLGDGFHVPTFCEGILMDSEKFISTPEIFANLSQQ